MISEWELDHAVQKAHSDGYNQGKADAIHKLKFIIELLEGNDSTLDIIKEVLEKEENGEARNET